MTASRPLELIPPVRQALWGWPAVVNFVAGGMGAGLYVAAALAAGFGPSPALATAAWLGPALVLAGFAAVATEAGRPLRGPRVLLRARTSWMSRELWLGGAFALAAPAALALGQPVIPVAAAAVAAGALALAQGQILRHARGVATWAVPTMPVVFLSSALVSGTGLLLLLAAGQGPLPARLLGQALAILALHLAVWWMYLGGSRDPAFLRGVQPLSGAAGTLAVIGAGYLLPSLLTALAIAVPAGSTLLAVPGALLMMAGQAYAKAVLVLRAGLLRPITLAPGAPGRRLP